MEQGAHVEPGLPPVEELERVDLADAPRAVEQVDACGMVQLAVAPPARPLVPRVQHRGEARRLVSQDRQDVRSAPNRSAYWRSRSAVSRSGSTVMLTSTGRSAAGSATAWRWRRASRAVSSGQAVRQRV